MGDGDLDAWAGWHDPSIGDGAHAPGLDGPMPDPAHEPESMVVPLASGVRIHYLDWGPAAAAGSAQGKGAASPRSAAFPPSTHAPALLLLHGISQTAWSWAPVCRRLRGSARVLAADLRGHGLSETPRAGYDLETLAWDALTVLAANGFGEEVGGPPAVVAGHGFGALVAATMAAAQPASVAGVALVDGGWEDAAAATRLSPAELLAGFADPPEVLRSMSAFLADREAFDPPTWDADQERAARAQVDEKHAGHVAMVSRPVAVRGLVDAMYAYRPDEALAAVRCPLLVLLAESGTADDEGAGERRLALEDVLRARLAAGPTAGATSEARVAVFGGVGHNLMRYRPAAVAAELRGLLARSRA